MSTGPTPNAPSLRHNHNCQTHVRQRSPDLTGSLAVLAFCKSVSFRRRRRGTQEGIGRWTDQSLRLVFLRLLSPPSLHSPCCFQLRQPKPTATVTTTTDTATSVGTAKSRTTTRTTTTTGAM